MKAGTSIARMPEKVFVNECAIATAGLAKDVDAVNQEAAVIYNPTSHGIEARAERSARRIVSTRLKVAPPLRRSTAALRCARGRSAIYA